MDDSNDREFDSPWKESWDLLLPEFMEFMYPSVHADVDWSEAYENLDTELQAIVREAELGRTVADKLFRVRMKNGKSAYLLIHIEVQSQVDALLPERLVVYYYRIWDRYGIRPVTLVVLGDENPNWNPKQFVHSEYESELTYKYRTIKLIDFLGREEELESSSNPAAMVVLAHLKSLETNRQPEARYQSKWRLVRQLIDRGWEPVMIRKMFRLIDWFLELPKGLEQKLTFNMVEYEREKTMPYVTTFERLAIERGEKQGLEKGLEKGREEGREEGREGVLEGIESLLEIRFESDGLALMGQIRKCSDLTKLRELQQKLRRAGSINEFREELARFG